LRDLRGLTKPVEESVDHDVRQNWVGVGTLKEFGMDDAEGLDSGTCDRSPQKGIGSWDSGWRK
jgi:hypothetical protein